MGQLMDKMTGHRCNKVLTFREEAAQPKEPRFSAQESREDRGAYLEPPEGVAEAERTVVQAGASDSGTDSKEAPLFRAEGSSKEDETLTSSTRMVAKGAAAHSGGRTKKTAATSTAALTGTIDSDTEPNEAPLSRAEGPSEGAEPRTPTVKRSRHEPAASWTVVPLSDEDGKADSMRRYLLATPATPASRATTRYPGPLLFGIEKSTLKLYPHIEPEAMENLLQGLDYVVWRDPLLWKLTTIEEWRGHAASGHLDHLGRAVERMVGRYGGHYDWNRRDGTQSTHMARIIVENTVQVLRHEHQQRHHSWGDRPLPGGEKTPGPKRRNAEQGRGVRALAPTIRKEGSRLAHQVAEEVTQQLRNDECTVETKKEALDSPTETEGNEAEGIIATAEDELSEDMTEEEEDATQSADRWQLPWQLATLLENAMETLWQGLSRKETKIVLREMETTIGEVAALRKLGYDKSAWRSQDVRGLVGTRGALLHERLWANRTFNVPENEYLMRRDDFLGQEIIDVAMTEWLRLDGGMDRSLEQEPGTEESYNQTEDAEWEASAARAMATDECNDGMNEEEQDVPQHAERWRLPRTLATLLGNSTEVFWTELSTAEIEIAVREMEATIGEVAAPCRLGNDKSTWRSPEARGLIGTRGAVLRGRLGMNQTFKGAEKARIMNEDDFLGQAIIDAAMNEWLREEAETSRPMNGDVFLGQVTTDATMEEGSRVDDETSRLPAQACTIETIEETVAAVNPQIAKEDTRNAAQLRRGRGCVGPLVRTGNFTFEDGTQIQGHVRTSRRPGSALEQPEEWNQHMLVCQRGCDMLPVLTPQRVMDHLRTGEATTISFHVREQEEATGVLFMSPLQSVRGAKLEGFNVDGIAVQEDHRGQGIGTLLMQVAKEEAILAAKEEGREAKKTALSITVQEQLQSWVYPQGFTRNVEGRSVSWGANSTSFYWQPDDLYPDATGEWEWTARGMINPDCLCQLVSVVQVLLGNDIFTRHLREAKWPLWRAGDTLLRLMFRPRDPSIEDRPKRRFRDIQDQRHLSRELIIRLYYVLRGKGGEERKMSEQQDAQEMLSNLGTALDEEQAEQRPVFLQGTQPSWTAQLWGVEMSATRRCMTCPATRVMTMVRESEIRVAASTKDQLLEDQVKQLTDTEEEMEANLCECGLATRWYKGTNITLEGSLLWVHISRSHVNENMRVPGRMRCPTTLWLRTSYGMVELRLTGIVIHTGEPIVVALPDGQQGETVPAGHYVANVHYRRREQDRVCHLDDSAYPYEAAHPEMYSSLDMLSTKGSGVESLALYQRIGTSSNALRGDDTSQQLRLSLGGLGVTALECQQRHPGGMLARGSKLHDLSEPKSWIMPKTALQSMQAWWQHAMLNTTKGLAPSGLGQEELQRHLTAKEKTLRQEPKGAEAIQNVLKTLGSALKNRRLWHNGDVHLITNGHYRDPLSSATPMVGWFGGTHSLTTGQTVNVTQAGVTLLFISGESLRLVGLGTTNASIDRTYEHLITQLRTLDGKNGIGVKCRITRLTAACPVVTWPGDWLAFVVGDLKSQDEGNCCSLISTAWRPESPQRIEEAKEAFSNTREERARHRLAQLGFPLPVRSTAAAWLQKGTTVWTTEELGYMTKLEEARTKGSGKTQKDATPVKEPRKRAAP
jgi:GNAT superfamily N-acetyltransferase